MIVTILAQNNGREYRFIMRNDGKGGVASFPVDKQLEDQRELIHLMNGNASDCVQDAEEFLTPEQAAKVKAIAALI